MVRSSRTRWLAWIACAICAMSLGIGAPASGAGEPGWWYLDDYGLADAHAKGYTGEGVTIALLDAPVDPSVAWLKDANITSLSNPVCAGIDGENELAGTTTDPKNAAHPTSMVGKYVGNGRTADGGRGPLGVAPRARIVTVPIDTAGTPSLTGKARFECLRPGNWGEVALDPRVGFAAADVAEEDQRGAAATAAGINLAIDAGADIIHMPFVQVDGIRPDSLLEAAMLRAVREGVIVVTGHANGPYRIVGTSSTPTDHSYFPGTLMVNSVDETGHLAEASNVADPGVDILAPGLNIWTHTGDPATYATSFQVGDGGTSSASAIMCGLLALLMNKHPDATGNQILRLAIASTHQGKGTITRDPENHFGWGLFSAAYTDTDPTTFPDVNPIYVYDIENALAYEKQREESTTHLHRSSWWNGLRRTDFSDLRDAWPKEFALYDEMTGKATPTPTASLRSTSTAVASATGSGSGLPAWAWITAGGAVLAAAGVAVVLAATRRTRTADGSPPGGPPPHRPINGNGQ